MRPDKDKIYCGDALTVLKTWPDSLVDCCVTSPPYWGLRDYGVEGQIGLEKTPEEYVAKMVEVFREVKRVLKTEATLWLNLGDTYSSHKDCKSTTDSLRVGDRSENANVIEKGMSHSRNTKMLKSVELKNKDLIGIPWMVAFALRADGWYLRQDIIWCKPNPMPESVTDRCTKAHEYIFLMSKSAKYYYDNEAIKEEQTSVYKSSDFIPKSKKDKNGDACAATKASKNNRSDDPINGKRNRRSVWTVNTHSFSEAHFATFPPKLIEPCILAGCPEGGIVLDPFMGSGTTACVAYENNRHYLGIELNEKYINLKRVKTAKEKYALLELNGN